jgi:hypothetical protein
MIAFKDFAPAWNEDEEEFAPFETAVDAANEWIARHGVHVMSVETVVLPNVWDEGEEGSTDSSLDVHDDYTSTWHQFVRVWYQA